MGKVKTASVPDKYDLAAASEVFSHQRHLDQFCEDCPAIVMISEIPRSFAGPGEPCCCDCPAEFDPTNPECERYCEISEFWAVREEALTLREEEAAEKEEGLEDGRRVA
jgi:hypothetical protein